MQESIHSLLKQYWGYDAFRPLQEDIINSVLQRKDTLALLPTGGGKSICYQIPGLVKEGLCLVISPLIALMKDQVEALKKKGIPATAIFSGMNSYEIDLSLNQSVYAKVKFLYVSPERLKSPAFLEHFKQMKIGLIAVDEAHCISQWGYDFRPPYLEIAKIRTYHPDVPVVALTATATTEVIEDICGKLSFKKDFQIFRKSFYRSNLIYIVYKEEDKKSRLLRIIKALPGTGLVYVRNRKQTQEIAEFLQKNGISSDFYHAGLSPKERDYKQNLWMSGKKRVIAATNAFGMGIDKPDVRFVAHLDIPDSPEAYFQEAGRGGRDEKTAYAILLYTNNDILNLDLQFSQSYPELNYIRNVYQAICNYYQVPVGSGEDLSFDFDIAGFCDTYNLKVILVFNAIKFLEKEGYLLLPDYQEAISKIFIPINKEQLYIFQVENKRFEPFIKLLLRSYGGMFTDFVPVHESELAKRIGSTEESVSKVLDILNQKQIIVYKKKTKKQQLVFTSARVPLNNVYISDANYKDLKQAAEKRKNAMQAYVQSADTCRSSLLLQYFGEKNLIKCGHCDVCIAEKKQTKQYRKDLADEIIRRLSEPIPIKSLVQEMSVLNEQEIIDLTRELLDAGILFLDSEMRLHVKEI